MRTPNQIEALLRGCMFTTNSDKVRMLAECLSQHSNRFNAHLMLVAALNEH